MERRTLHLRNDGNSNIYGGDRHKNHMQSKDHTYVTHYATLLSETELQEKSIMYGYDGPMQTKSSKRTERGVSGSGEWNRPCWQSYMQLSSGLLCWVASPRVPYLLSNCVREGGEREGGDRKKDGGKGERRREGEREGGEMEEIEKGRGKEEIEREGGEMEEVEKEREREEIEEGREGRERVLE